MDKRHAKIPKKKLYIGIVIGLVLLVILSMPSWYVKSIIVNNNSYYTQEEIIATSGLQDRNLLDISFNKAKKQLMALAYIQDVQIKYQFPGNIIIHLKENAPLMYVPFSGSYLCLNEQGQVIEQTNQQKIAIPIVKGLKFAEFKVGEMLAIENDDTFLAAKDMIHILRAYEYQDKIKEMDVYNLEEIHLYVDNLDVIMGGIGDFDKKLQWLIATHETYDMGILDLSQAVKSGQASLRPIT